MILILTCAEDATADVVDMKLRRRGAHLIRVDNGQFPAQAEVSMAYTARGAGRRLLRLEGKTVDLSEITAAWYRRPLPPVPHAVVADHPTREYAAGEAKAFMRGVWHSLDCLWLPAKLSQIERAEDKVAQLGLAGELGFELPPTLITNSPRDFLDFYRQHRGHIISKVVRSPVLILDGEELSGFEMKTALVGSRDLGYAHSIRYAPTIFQAYVPKRLELRITVVGEQVFACEIHSQQARHTRHDWRRYDLARTPHLPHRLPEDVRRRCLRLVARLGLCYGAIDMVLTPDGRYVFLEVNPNGQYAWIEQLTGLPISDAICNLLESREPTRDRPAPSEARSSWDLGAPQINDLRPAAGPAEGGVCSD